MAASPEMSRPQRRIRRNTKALDSLKAAAIIVSLLFGCILVAWIAVQWMKHPEPQPDTTPKPGQSMFETPADHR